MSARMNNAFDEERFTALLADAVDRVKTEEDPAVLNELKKLFKKNVPFSLRMYVAAYLAKGAMYGSRSPYRNTRRDFSNKTSGERSGRRDFNRREDRPEPVARDTETTYRRTRTEAEPSADSRPLSRRVTIDESLATTIFIGIGRNRRVFPRDLVGLLVQVAGLSRDRIGDIRTLDNYSFVQLFSEDTEGVIQALNGYDYRGRKLSVSYSRKKDDESLEEDSYACSETDEPDALSADDSYAYETDCGCDGEDSDNGTSKANAE